MSRCAIEKAALPKRGGGPEQVAGGPLRLTPNEPMPRYNTELRLNPHGPKDDVFANDDWFYWTEIVVSNNPRCRSFTNQLWLNNPTCTTWLWSHWQG